MAHEAWLLETYIPLVADENKDLSSLEKGGFYGFGRDKQMRPIIIQNLRSMLDSGVTGENYLKELDLAFGVMQFTAMVPGSIE